MAKHCTFRSASTCGFIETKLGPCDTCPFKATDSIPPPQKGEKGDKGDKGDTVVGPMGPPGIQGQGKDGRIGIIGLTGFPGMDGRDGRPGDSIKGDKGDPGSPGQSIDMKALEELIKRKVNDKQVLIGWGARKAVPTGAAGGELAGTYPNPTVASVHSGSAHHDESHTVVSHSGTAALLADGSIPLTADWDVGAFKITAAEFRLFDNEPITFGSAVEGDASLKYDGSNLIFNVVNSANQIRYNVDMNMTGNTIYGSFSSAGNLVLASTSHATKGAIFFGNSLKSIFVETTDRLSINTVLAAAQLHVDQRDSDGGIPVLKLDQADLSKQCIQFSSDGVDRDINLFTVDVTGAPTFKWAEAANKFEFPTGLKVTGDFFNDGDLSVSGGAGIDGSLEVNADGIFVDDIDSATGDTVTMGQNLVVTEDLTVGAAEKVLIGVLPGGHAQADDGVRFNAAGSIPSGIFSQTPGGTAGEAAGFAVNTNLVGTYQAGRVGGYLRIDTVAASRRMVLQGTDGSTFVDMFSVPLHPSLQGEVDAWMRTDDGEIRVLGNRAGACIVDIRAPNANNLSAFRLIPNGSPSPDRALCQFFGTDWNADGNNYTAMAFIATATKMIVRSQGEGTTSAVPLAFEIRTGGANLEGLRLDTAAQVIINEGGFDRDFRVEGDNDEDLIHTDAANDRVGISTATPLSTHDVEGSVAGNITAISGTTTLDVTHHVVTCDASGGAFTVTLPAASGVTRRIYHIKKIDSSGNAVTVDGNSSETIDGATTQVINVQYDSMMISCDGSNWHII